MLCIPDMLSQLSAVGSGVIYVSLSSRHRKIFWALCLRQPCELSCSITAESALPRRILMLSELLSNSQKGSVSMHRKAGVSTAYVWIVKFRLKCLSLVLAKLVKHLFFAQLKP